MSIPLRVATWTTAFALTLMPDMGVAYADKKADKKADKRVVVQIHRKQAERQQIHRKKQLSRKQQQRAALVALQRRVRVKRAHMVARWQSRANRAVRFAYRQRGKPYRWGGTGPRGYDCSGLVQRSWRAAGVRIPRVTYGQYRIRTHISRRSLRPGDLVFFRGLGHVGMYVGRGKFIHSPHSGSHVKTERLRGYYRRAFVGAVRPAWHRLPRIPTHL
jgi:cell wall-associated NlpC family hydrolase